MEDATGITTYAYDELNRPKTVTYPAGKTITYAYDAVGNRSTLNDPDGGITTYSYDSRNLLSSLLNPFAERTTWIYDALGGVTTMTLGNGALAQHEYDAARRLTALRNLKSDLSVISIFTYSYDAVGNRSGVAEANGDRVTWSYDEAYQLTREQRSGANSYDITYTYDGLGNRLTKIESGAVTTYAYDAANELSTAEDNTGLTTFTYDANGNTTGEIRPNADRVTYTWDIENHLTKVELPSAVVNTITLDGDGKRRRIEDSAGLRNIIWDMENIVAELDSGNATLAQYTLAPEGYGALISQRRSGSSSFHHFDALGSTDRLTDGSANTLAAYLYRAFGQQTIVSGSSPNPFTWVGRLGYYRQPDPDDYWVRTAVLNPKQGRRLNRETLSGGNNQYLWVENDPINWVDPEGLKKKPPWPKPLPPTACQKTLACFKRLGIKEHPTDCQKCYTEPPSLAKWIVAVAFLSGGTRVHRWGADSLRAAGEEIKKCCPKEDWEGKSGSGVCWRLTRPPGRQKPPTPPYECGKCPSNHSLGLAVDILPWGTPSKCVRDIMARYHWKWFGPGDPVHFDHPCAPSSPPPPRCCPPPK